jgi:hypothetical protein
MMQRMPIFFIMSFTVVVVVVAAAAAAAAAAVFVNFNYIGATHHIIICLLCLFVGVLVCWCLYTAV